MVALFTHGGIHSEVFETPEFAEVFLKFGVNVQIFGFGIFQEGPEFLQPIELTCRERGERGREMLGQRVVENKQVQRRGTATQAQLGVRGRWPR